MLTNPRDAFRGHSRSPKVVPFDMFGIYGFLCYGKFLAFQIIDFKKCRDLEIRVRGHLRTLKVVPFYRLRMVSYYCPVVTLSVRRTIFEVFDVKNAVTLKSGLGVTQGHRNSLKSIRQLSFHINVPQ